MKTHRYHRVFGLMLAVVVMVGVLTLTMASSFVGGNMSVGSKVPLALASAPSDSPEFFLYNYTSWPSSTTRKSTDHMVDALYFAAKGSILSTFIDINGDGLNDIVYVAAKSNFGGSGMSGGIYLLFLNTGNNNFEVSYKCAITDDGRWYGDCAA